MNNAPGPSQQQANQAAGNYGLHQGYQTYDTQQQVTNQVDQRVEADAKGQHLPGPLASMLKWLNEAQATAQYNNKLSNEAMGLIRGLSTRSAPGFQAANYLSYSHPQLHQMVTNGVDPGTVGQVGDTWLDMGNDLTSFQGEFARALAGSETNWTGANADAARRSIAELGNSGGAIGQAAQLAGVITHQQSEALANAKNSMPPPPAQPFNPQAAQQRSQKVTDPGLLAILVAADHAQAAQQQQAHQQAARIVGEYDTTVAQTSTNMPNFAPTPQVTKPTSSPTHSAGPASHHQLAAPHGGNRNPVAPAGSLSQRPRAASTPGQPVGVYPSGTSTSDYSNPGNALQGNIINPVVTGSGPAGNAFDGGMFGPVGGSVGGPGADIPPSGSGGFGSGSAGRAAVPGSPGRGVRSGVGANTAATEEAAAERAAASGRAGSSPGGMMPGARGRKGSEDTEHQRPSYLLEPDANEIFGTDEKTVPPVIGG